MNYRSLAVALLASVSVLSAPIAHAAPSPTATATPTPSVATTATPRPTPGATAAASATPRPAATPAATPTVTPSATVTPRPAAKPAGVAPIDQKYAELGGPSGVLGAQTGGPACGLTREGCFSVYQGGSIYFSPASGAHFTRGYIRQAWGAQGWEAGWLGYPTSDEECWIANGCFQRFQGGMIYFNPQAGTHFIRGAIFDEWGRNGWEGGFLGYPTSDEQCWIRGGCFQTFQGGSIYWSPATGAQFIRGAIFEHWGRNGWEGGHLGYPTSGEYCGLAGGGCGQRFQNGIISWSPATGAHYVKGAILQKYGEWGYETGFGYPLTDEICGMKNGGCRQVFQGNDHIYWSPRTGAYAVFAEMMGPWGQHGWENGRLGYPVGDPYRDDRQSPTEIGIEFQGGWLYFYENDPRNVMVHFK